MKSRFDIVVYEEEEGGLYIPNEIFADVMRELGDVPSQVAFAYSYYYLITYLYRFAKYKLGEGLFTQPNLKEFLGYSSGNKKIDFIIKKDGVLDRIKYTETTTSYPISWTPNELGMVEFESYSSIKKREMFDIDKTEVNSRNFKVKKPLKAFEREGFDCGTFYGVENTHFVPIKHFLQCMDDEELGANGFYIYAFLGWKCSMFKDGYRVTASELVDITSIKRSTLFKYLKRLEDRNLISVTSTRVGIRNFPNIYYVIG